MEKGEIVTTIVAEMTAGFLQALIGSWLFMLVVGIIHLQWIPQLPTIGYGNAVLISVLLSFAFHVLSYDRSKNA